MPAFVQDPVLEHRKHDKAQADKIKSVVHNMNCPGSNIIMVTTVTTKDQFWVFVASDCSAVNRR